MRSTPLLIEAKPMHGHVVHVRFEDGVTADVDLSYLLEYGGVFEPLQDPDFFRGLRADAEAGTIVWPNDADVAPETLYAHAQRRAGATA
jgi:hypothetical protein